MRPLLYGHQRTGSLYYPTILADTPVHCLLWQEEVFAPVVTLKAFDTLNEAIALTNDTEYSLHAGIFTNSLPDALNAASRIDAAGLMVNDNDTNESRLHQPRGNTHMMPPILLETSSALRGPAAAPVLVKCPVELELDFLPHILFGCGTSCPMEASPCP